MAESLAFLLEFSSAGAAAEARDAGKALTDLDGAMGKVGDGAKEAKKPLDDLGEAMGKVGGASDKLGESFAKTNATMGLTLAQHQKVAESFGQMFQNVRESSLSMKEHSAIAQSLGNFFGGLGKAAEERSKQVYNLGDAARVAKQKISDFSFSGLKGVAAVGAVAGGVYGIGQAVGFVKDAWVGVVEVIGRGIEKAYEWGSVIVDSASKAERARVGLDVSLGSKAGGAAAGYIRQVTRGGIGSFKEQELASPVQRLAQAGFSGGALARALTAATDVEAGQGGGVGTVERAAHLFSKIKLSGKVEAEALTELGIDAGVFFADLAKRRGVSEKTARQLAAQGGGIKADTLLNAVQQAIAGQGGTLGEKTLKAAGTVESKLSQLKALPDRYFRAVANTAGYGKLSDVLTQILEKFDPDGPQGKKITAAFGRISEGIARVFGNVDGDLFDTLADGIVFFLDGIRATIPWIKAFVDLAGRAAGAFGETYEFIQKIGNIRQSVIGGWGALGDKLSAGFGLGGKGEQAGEEVGSGIDKGTRAALGVHSPSTVFDEIGRHSRAGFDQGFEAGPAVPRAGGVLSSAPAAARGGAGGIVVHMTFAPEIHTTGNADEIVEVVQQRLLPRIATELASEIRGLNVEWGVG
jgi:hypothetical protein